MLDTPLNPAEAPTVPDLVARAVATVVHRECQTTPALTPTTKVVAGIVLTDTRNNNAWVISWATGTRTVNGNHMRMDGRAVNDSHAEILARRGLLRCARRSMFHDNARCAQVSVRTGGCGNTATGQYIRADVLGGSAGRGATAFEVVPQYSFVHQYGTVR